MPRWTEDLTFDFAPADILFLSSAESDALSNEGILFLEHLV